MKNSFRAFLFSILWLLIAFGSWNCNKIQDFVQGLPDCLVQQYSVSNLGTSPYLFKKTYDKSGKFVEEIDLCFYGFQPRILQSLILKSNQKKLWLVYKSHPLDTAFVITFNNAGRPATITSNTSTPGFQTTFTYLNNRLDSVKHMGDFGKFKCFYDQNGNILSMKKFEPDLGVYSGSFYEYDYSKRIKTQVYFDELIGFSKEGMTLLQYLDFFPELNPRNIRIRTRAGLETHYFLGNYGLVNHQVDGEGKLISYQLIPDIGPSFSQQGIIWKCGKTNPQH